MTISRQLAWANWAAPVYLIYRPTETDSETDSVNAASN